MTEEISTERRFIQNFRLIWFDPVINQSDDNNETNLIDQLQMVFQTVCKFSDINQCINFLTDIQAEKVCMIISNSVDEHLISCIHDIPQLDSIFIYHPAESINDKWIKNWSKIKGIFYQDISLIRSLKLKARQYDENSIPISIIPHDVDLTKNFDQLADPTFIYTQILKEILLEIKYGERSINDLANYLRTLYLDNQQTLNEIGRFEQEYNPQSSIWWYTSAVFIYSTLNEALRTLKVDTIIKMGKFIHDLDKNIVKLHNEQKSIEAFREFNVYRGQRMTNKDFKKLQNSKGGLLSFNNFLSTSLFETFPLMLAESAATPNDQNVVGVLFQMKINESCSSDHYAYINDISQHNSEEEILFSMNTIFRIGEIKALNDTNRLWQVNLTITKDDDKDLTALADHLRKETKDTTGWFRLVQLLIRLGEFKKAKEVCDTLLQTTLKEGEKALIYGQLGYIHDNLNKYRQAISFYEKALEIMSRFVSSDDERVASTYNNIGIAFKNLGEPRNALTFLEQGLKIYEKVLPSNHSYFGVIYNNIGLMYDQLGDKPKALNFYLKSIDFKNTLPENHPGLATTYKNIAGIYKDQGSYLKALDYIEKALEIEKRSLPKNHPSFAPSYNHMGNIYKNLGKYSEAISFYQKAIQISKQHYGENHLDVATGYGNISSTYIKTGEYKKAVAKGEKAIEIEKRIYGEDHIQLATHYNTVGLAYEHLQQHEKALLLCQKAVSIYENTPNADPSERANAYISVGGINMSTGKNEQALRYFEKGRNIQESILPADHPDLANTYTNIGQAYFAMRNHARALFLSGKGLIIRRKIFPRYHPELIISYISVAGPLLALDQRPAARLAYKYAVEIARHSLPIYHKQRQACEMMYRLLSG